MQLATLKERFRGLNFNTIVGDALEAQKAELIEYQKAQMLHGENVDGKKIGKYKNPNYARKKYNMNPLAGYGNVDLRLEGEFQRNINVRFFAESFVIFSVDWKAEKLLDAYGQAIFGLNAGFIKDFSQVYFAAEMQRQIEKNIYGV